MSTRISRPIKYDKDGRPIIKRIRIHKCGRNCPLHKKGK